MPVERPCDRLRLRQSEPGDFDHRDGERRRDLHLAQYSYDSLGRRTQTSRGPSGSLAATGYGYDGLDRLSHLVHSFANSGMNLTLGLTRMPSDQLSGKTVSNAGYVYAPPALATSYSANGLNQYAQVAGTSYTCDGRRVLTSGASPMTSDTIRR